MFDDPHKFHFFQIQHHNLCPVCTLKAPLVPCHDLKAEMGGGEGWSRQNRSHLPRAVKLFGGSQGNRFKISHVLPYPRRLKVEGGKVQLSS